MLNCNTAIDGYIWYLYILPQCLCTSFLQNWWQDLKSFSTCQVNTSPVAVSSKEHVKTLWLKPRRKAPDEQVFWNRMFHNPRQRSGPCSSHWTSRASKHISISGIWGFSFHRALWREARGNTKNCQMSQEDISSFTDAIVIIQCNSSPQRNHFMQITNVVHLKLN